jgi:hypothetical protein
MEISFMSSRMRLGDLCVSPFDFHVFVERRTRSNKSEYWRVVDDGGFILGRDPESGLLAFRTPALVLDGPLAAVACATRDEACAHFEAYCDQEDNPYVTLRGHDPRLEMGAQTDRAGRAPAGIPLDPIPQPRLGAQRGS